MLIFVLLIVFVVIIDLTARYYEKHQIAQTRVSTLRETDFAQPTHANLFVWGGMVLAILALVSGLVWPVPLVAGLSVIALYLLFRITLVDQAITGARLSIRARFYEAMAHPEIKKARFAFYFSAPDLEQPEHVKMWASEINALDVPWFVILREARHLDAFEAASLPPAVFVPDDASLATCLPPEVNAVFYANNGQKNRRMIALHPRATHIQLLHGDSDKPPSYSPLTQNYDLVFVAGQMGIDRYAQNGVNISADRFRIVGRPQVRAISDSRPVPAGAARKVAYMPTWRGFFEDAQFSSLDRAREIIETILASDKSLELHFKPHPLSYKDPLWPQFEREIHAALTRKRPNGNRGVICKNDIAPFDLYNEADLLITDISSVMIDYLYSGKPFLVIQPPNYDAANSASFPSLAAGYQVASTLENLPSQLEAAMVGDPLATKREEIRLYAFGDYGRPPGEAFCETCMALLKVTCAEPLSKGDNRD